MYLDVQALLDEEEDDDLADFESLEPAPSTAAGFNLNIASAVGTPNPKPQRECSVGEEEGELTVHPSFGTGGSVETGGRGAVMGHGGGGTFGGGGADEDPGPKSAFSRKRIPRRGRGGGNRAGTAGGDGGGADGGVSVAVGVKRERHDDVMMDTDGGDGILRGGGSPDGNPAARGMEDDGGGEGDADADADIEMRDQHTFVPLEPDEVKLVEHICRRVNEPKKHLVRLLV